ncbi:serine/threonine protein kinase [Brasilonema sp. CT11]|nr:serine/threonine protein kinase [Brasilonema sp. CT11]
MEIYCTRPHCPKSINSFPDLNEPLDLKNVRQKYCITCGMPLFLDGRYVPLKELRKGGFGAAFLAYDRRTPAMRKCVVKQLQPSASLNEEQIQKTTQLFHREAEVLETLGTHPQIPELFAFINLRVPSREGQKTEELFYLVQQYIDGEDLEQELNRKGMFSEAEVLEVLQKILPVLEFVHTHDSIHRDIKPSNIMRARNGSLYLIDFGAVKQVVKATPEQQGSNSPNGIHSGMLTGIYTPGFAPSEQTACLAVYPSTDLYALAATCVCLLTGKKQIKHFIDPNTKTWFWRSPKVKVSDRLANVLERMLKDKPKERYQLATEVINALQPTSNMTSKLLNNLEWLIKPFLIGFEIALLAIGFNKLPILINGVLVSITLASLIYAQHRRIITRHNLSILTGSTLVVVLLLLSDLPARLEIPFLNILLQNHPIYVILFAILSGIFAFTLLGLSQLIYQLLARII